MPKISQLINLVFSLKLHFQNELNEIIEGFEANYIFTEIANLPVGYRTVLNLYCIEGYKHQEIARILNIKENTSRSQLNKAKKLLKERLAANNKKDERKRF